MSKPHYLNVDLVVDSLEELTPLVEGFGENVFVLFNGRVGEHYRVIFEISGGDSTANDDIALFCSLIDALQGEALRCWQNAFSREFDLGFESGLEGEQVRIALQPDVISRIAACGASIAVTVYPINPSDMLLN
jgi:hypothetical protein